jgi:hypothetical protein
VMSHRAAAGRAEHAVMDHVPRHAADHGALDAAFRLRWLRSESSKRQHCGKEYRESHTVGSLLREKQRLAAIAVASAEQIAR